jgi:hypothetical protein
MKKSTKDIIFSLITQPCNYVKVIAVYDGIEYVSRTVSEFNTATTSATYPQFNIIDGVMILEATMIWGASCITFELRTRKRITEDKIIKRDGGVPLRNLNIECIADNTCIQISIGHRRFRCLIDNDTTGLLYASNTVNDLLAKYAVAIDRDFELVLLPYNTDDEILTFDASLSVYQELQSRLLQDVRDRMREEVHGAVRNCDITYLEAAKEGNFFEPINTDGSCAEGDECLSIALKVGMYEVCDWLVHNKLARIDSCKSSCV